MTKALFVLAAALYWITFIGRLVAWFQPKSRLELASGAVEKTAMLAFTGALVLYIKIGRAHV